MTTNLKKVFYFSFFLSVCVGFFLHFFYELSKYSRIVGLFSPINESPWEHLKMLFYPFLIFTIILHCITKRNSQNLIFANSICVFIGMLLIIALFYTMHGALGTQFFLLDIVNYLFSTAFTFFLCMYFVKNNTFSINNTLGCLVFVFMFLIFTILTFIPPRIPLFQDPNTKSFGLIHH